jgi:hypothetical protein
MLPDCAASKPMHLITQADDWDCRASIHCNSIIIKTLAKTHYGQCWIPQTFQQVSCDMAHTSCLHTFLGNLPEEDIAS